MALDSLILIANPGSASRKYALFQGATCLLKIHFEFENGDITYRTEKAGEVSEARPAGLSHLAFASHMLPDILQAAGLDIAPIAVKTIALRIVAPSSYFQQDRKLDKTALAKLGELEVRAPLHINASLQEAHALQHYFPDARLMGISDSGFHASLSGPAQYYGLPLKTAQKLDIKRFGYHGLSVESVVNILRAEDKLPLRLIVCHLGSGSSITAVRNGKSIDTTMGYSPLEGLVMATRSGSVDVAAALALQRELKLSSSQLDDYLNHKSGLLGLSGTSADTRELLKLEQDGDKAAHLALESYIYHVQLGIGQMAAALGGLDALVFTGTVGERSAPVRRRILERLLFLGLVLDHEANHRPITSGKPTRLSRAEQPPRIYVVPADEDGTMADHAARLA